jgi:hypothetical protein
MDPHFLVKLRFPLPSPPNESHGCVSRLSLSFFFTFVLHSCLRATIRFSLIAFRAGTQHAEKALSNKTAEAATNVVASVGPIP